MQSNNDKSGISDTITSKSLKDWIIDLTTYSSEQADKVISNIINKKLQ